MKKFFVVAILLIVLFVLYKRFIHKPFPKVIVVTGPHASVADNSTLSTNGWIKLRGDIARWVDSLHASRETQLLFSGALNKMSAAEIRDAHDYIFEYVKLNRIVLDPGLKARIEAISKKYNIF